MMTVLILVLILMLVLESGDGGGDGVAPTIKQPPKKTLNLWCLQIFAIVH